jgi:hypothetical protein
MLEHEQMVVDEYERLTSDRVEVTNGAYPWYFSAKSFAEFVDDLESATSWKYSGDVELLLLNADNTDEHLYFHLDYSRVISINLTQACKTGAINSAQNCHQKRTNLR